MAGIRRVYCPVSRLDGTLLDSETLRTNRRKTLETVTKSGKRLQCDRRYFRAVYRLARVAKRKPTKTRQRVFGDTAVLYNDQVPTKLPLEIHRQSPPPNLTRRYVRKVLGLNFRSPLPSLSKGVTVRNFHEFGHDGLGVHFPAHVYVTSRTS